jgi:hypothetical protein
VGKREYEALPPQEREKTHWRRCYRSVFLLHLAASAHVFCGLSVLPGKESELPWLRRLVDDFVGSVGKGVIKLLIFDRGFIDGPTISHLKVDHGIDTLFPLKAGMLDWADARRLADVDGRPWETWTPPAPEPPPEPPDRPEVIRRRERARQRSLEELRRETGVEPVTIQRVELKRIPDMRLWETMTVPTHVVLLREYRSDGTESEWAPATTDPSLDAMSGNGIASSSASGT